ncbi:MAG: alpha/beta fold hydrolase, partial [Myxococcaceae bacterium]|nr:alpha/beta fold hydrolase [Myxococcaceae bacterium]
MATYALIPGGGGDPWEWHRLVPELERLGHEAIALRLPAEDDENGWSEYADAVVAALRGKKNVVLVAESLGGFTAPIVAARRKVEQLVLLNAMIPKPGETGMAWGRNTRASGARHRYYRRIMLSRAKAEDEAVSYYHDLPKALAAEAKRRT